MKDTTQMAFPTNWDNGDNVQEGMTLRDYFAAKAMQSLATYEEYPPERAAKKAYEYADAMMEARK